MSAERLAALKASAARTRLRMQLVEQLNRPLNGQLKTALNVRPLDAASPTQASQAFPRLMPKSDPRFTTRTRPSR